MELQANNTIKDILNKLKTKDVYILLRSGKEYTGSIKDVGEFCVVLAQTGSRSFYDSIIRIDDISAIEIRVREK